MFVYIYFLFVFVQAHTLYTKLYPNFYQLIHISKQFIFLINVQSFIVWVYNHLISLLLMDIKVIKFQLLFMINSLGYIIHWKNSESKNMNFLKVFKLWSDFNQKGYSNLHYYQQYMIIIEINAQCRKLENVGMHKKYIKNHPLFTCFFFLQTTNICDAPTVCQGLLQGLGYKSAQSRQKATLYWSFSVSEERNKMSKTHHILDDRECCGAKGGQSLPGFGASVLQKMGNQQRILTGRVIYLTNVLTGSLAAVQLQNEERKRGDQL